VVVEDYVSVLAADAIGRVRSVGLCPAVESAQTPEPERCGHVVGQQPPAGEQLLRGQLVQLFVAERTPHGLLQPSTTASTGQRGETADRNAGSPRRRKRAEGRTGSVSSGDGGSRAAAMNAGDPDGDGWSEYFEEGKSPGDGQAPLRELLAASAEADAAAVQIVADAACDGELSTPGLDSRASRTATRDVNRDRNGRGALTSRAPLAGGGDGRSRRVGLCWDCSRLRW
jgi:hypothetical protein